MRSKLAGDGISAEDVHGELARIGYTLKPLDIVLVWTGTSAHFHEKGYDQMHAGLRADATRWLVEAGGKVIGIDARGLDRPFTVMAQEAGAGHPEVFWGSHFYGGGRQDHDVQHRGHPGEAAPPRRFTR